MSRLRYNNSLGTLGASLTSSGTTITFALAPSWATLTSPDYIPLVLDPATSSPNANFEVVHVTAYTAGATTATIARGQESTTGVAHSSGVTWMVAPTANDVLTGDAFFNPRAFGAKGDGTTDDASAIQSCFNAAAGVGVVIFPFNTTYLIGSQVNIPANSVILCPATIKCKSGVGAITMLSPQNTTYITWDGLGVGVIDGNSTAQFGVNGGGTSAQFHTYRGFTVKNVNSASGGWGINVTCADLVFEDVIQHDCANAWIVEGTASKRVRIRGGSAYNITNDWGLAIYGGCSDVVVEGFVTYNCTQHGMGVFSDAGATSACDNVKFIGCTSYSNQLSGFISYATSPNTHHTRVQFIDCTSRLNNQSNGTGVSSAGFAAFATDWIDFIDCTSEKNGNGANGACGFYLDTCNNVTVRHPSALDEGQGSTAGIGISLASSLATVLIDDPVIEDDQGTKTMKYMIQATSDISNGRVRGGLLSTPITSAINGWAHFLSGVRDVTGFAPLYAFEAYRNAAFTPGSSTTDVQIPYDTVSDDPAGGFTTGTTAHYTIPNGGGGYWLFEARASQGGGSTRIFIDTYVNGSVVDRSNDGTSSAGGAKAVTLYKMSAGDTVAMYVWMLAAGALDVGNPYLHFRGALVGQG